MKVTRNNQKFMQGAHPLYNPRKGKIIPSKDSLCVEVQRNQKTGDCETCHQCDYELEYADQSSSMGVLARDDLHLMVANGSFTKSSVVFGYLSLSLCIVFFVNLLTYVINSICEVCEYVSTPKFFRFFICQMCI